MKYLKKYKINENIGSDNNYSIELNPELFYYGINYKGDNSPEITCNPIKLFFNIDMEIREFGVKSISIYNIKGPEVVNFFIKYYVDEDIEKEDEVGINLNWENAKLTNTKENGTITLNNLEIYLSEENGVIKQSSENQIEITATYI